MKTGRLLLATTVLLSVIAMSAQPATAATVTLKNGDRLTGSVSKLQDSKLYLATEYSEKDLVVIWQQVAFIETDNEITVVMDSGDVVKGRLSPSPIAGRHEISGARISVEDISLDEITTINPPAVTPAKLEGSITVGGSHQSGNTERAGASLAVDALRKDNRHRYTFGLLYNYVEEDAVVTERNLFTRMKYDYFFTKKLYGYLNTEFLYDKFKDLNLRTVVGPGVGYQVWDDDIKALAFEAGLAYYNEDRDEGEDDSWVTARLAAIFAYKFSNGMKFTETLTVYPSLENSDDFTLRNEAALTSPLAFGWSLQLRNIIDHDNSPDSPDVEKTDYSWILGLNYSF